MDLVDTQLPKSPESPNAIAVPSATAAVLAASSTIPVNTQDSRNAFLVQVRHLATGVTDIFVPAPVRQDWVLLFTTFYNKVSRYPAKYRYSFLSVVILIALAEWQDSGYVPCPQYLSNAIIGFVCATLLAFGWLAMLEYIETRKWPWEEDGWVWPWQAWLWQETVYDLGTSTSTRADCFTSPLRSATPTIEPSPPEPTFSSPATQTMSNTPTEKVATFDFSIPPPATFKQSIIIPPTPQLSGGLRSIYLPLPTPVQIHKPGILGESPMPPRFKYLSDDSFTKNNEELRTITEWSSPGTSKLLQASRKSMPSVLSEKRTAEAFEDEKTTKKSKTPMLIENMPKAPLPDAERLGSKVHMDSVSNIEE
jgi:hypothetical protein